jgi:hypothetical protein
MRTDSGGISTSTIATGLWANIFRKTLIRLTENYRAQPKARRQNTIKLVVICAPVAQLWSKKCMSNTIKHLQPAALHPILVMSLGTMNINALVISGSDPGAVPGDSTNHPSFWGAFIWGSWGRNRIDERLKVLALFRLSATVIGETCTIANDNRAPMALAA